jgi:hypothetical protein
LDHGTRNADQSFFLEKPRQNSNISTNGRVLICNVSPSGLVFEKGQQWQDKINFHGSRFHHHPVAPAEYTNQTQKGQRENQQVNNGRHYEKERQQEATCCCW